MKGCLHLSGPQESGFFSGYTFEMNKIVNYCDLRFHESSWNNWNLDQFVIS